MLSVRRATPRPHPARRAKTISIHALREEGDRNHHAPEAAKGDFYPRPPRGGRPLSAFLPSTAFRFLSTPSARRATGFERTVDLVLAISIHALREEGDHRGHRKYPRQYHFYPRPPRGGRLRKAQKDLGLPYISIHALREEGDELLSEF